MLTIDVMSSVLNELVSPNEISNFQSLKAAPKYMSRLSAAKLPNANLPPYVLNPIWTYIE